MKSDNKYSPNQVLTNKQIDILTAPDSTWKGGVIAETIDFEGEFANQVFSEELINEVNEERPWTGVNVVAGADFTEDESSLLYEIREMVKAIAAYHKHTIKDSSLGYVIRADKLRLNITRDGLVGGYFSVEPFDGFDDYEFWINKVKTDSYGTVIADNIAFNLSKTKNAKGKFR